MNLEEYKIELLSDFDELINFYTGKDKMVIESYLQTLELGTLASGEYTISVSCDTSKATGRSSSSLHPTVVAAHPMQRAYINSLFIFSPFNVRYHPVFQ